AGVGCDLAAAVDRERAAAQNLRAADLYDPAMDDPVSAVTGCVAPVKREPALAGLGDIARAGDAIVAVDDELSVGRRLARVGNIDRRRAAGGVDRLPSHHRDRAAAQSVIG